MEDKADEMLRSPLGCAFLLAAAASGLPPEEIASPRNCLYLAAYAARDADPRQVQYEQIRDELLRQGRQNRDLAVSILEQPAAANWFGPLDTDRQVYVPYERDQQPPGPANFESSASARSGGVRIPETADDGLLTSTLDGGIASILASLDFNLGHMHWGQAQAPPYVGWFLRADPSARVFEIDGPQAWHDLCAHYPAAGANDRQTPEFLRRDGRLIPDWPAVANDWDAVHLTFGGLLTASQAPVESEVGWTCLWSWDIEQTQWLRWMFDLIERLPDHERWVSPLSGLFDPLFVSRARLHESGVTIAKSAIDFPDELPPPKERPDVYLVRRGSGHERRQLAPVPLDPPTGGRVRLRKSAIDWPAPIELSESDTAAIKLASEAAPTTIFIGLYDRLEANGAPAGDPAVSWSCLHPRWFTGDKKANQLDLTYSSDDGVLGWEFTLPIPPSNGTLFIIVLVMWFAKKQRPYRARWALAVRTHTAAG